jgi:S1-C subfamily serine protease
MNGRSLALLLIAPALGAAVLGAALPVCAQQDMSGAVSRVNDSVFTIKAAKSLGSGFVIDAQGNALTCKHVLGDATQVDVTLANGDKTKANVVAKDDAHDLALLKLDRAGLPAVVFAHPDAIQTGARVAAVGAPLGLTNSVTEGVVSALDREVNGQKYMQIDAALNSGSSGGPVVDDHGDVVGIATATVEKATNIGLALPSGIALDFLKAQHLTGAVALVGAPATGPAAPTAPATAPPAASPAAPPPPLPPPSSSAAWMVPVLSLVISLVVSLLVSLLVTRMAWQRMAPGGGALPPTPGYLPPPPPAAGPPPQQQDLSDIDITLG